MDSEAETVGCTVEAVEAQLGNIEPNIVSMRSRAAQPKAGVALLLLEVAVQPHVLMLAATHEFSATWRKT